MLSTPLAPEAVALRGDSVKKVQFSVDKGPSGEAVCQVTLSNGDVLTGVIGLIDDKQVTLSSSVVGPLVIPRGMVSALRIGVTLPNMLFNGPTGLGGWKRDQASADQWSFDQGAMRVQGAGGISRAFDLPQQFIVRFKLAWDDNPNLKFSFASPAKPEDGPMDRYFLQFNAAGVGLRREAADGSKRYQLLGTLNRLPQEFPGKRLTVELRVDRAAKTMELFLNGEPEGVFKDPMAQAPTGGGIAFESMAEKGQGLNISEIQIADWNSKDNLRPLDDRGDKTKDALIAIEAERFSGRLVGTKQGPDGLLYIFKSAFQENALEVPEIEVATIFLAESDEGPVAGAPGPLCLRFQGGGSLRVSDCSFSEHEVVATHPLLGPLKLQRDRVTAFERMAENPKAEVKKKES
jgi:hypothetical protein